VKRRLRYSGSKVDREGDGNIIEDGFKGCRCWLKGCGDVYFELLVIEPAEKSILLEEEGVVVALVAHGDGGVPTMSDVKSTKAEFCGAHGCTNSKFDKLDVMFFNGTWQKMNESVHFLLL